MVKRLNVRGRSPNGKGNPVDRHVGLRMRQRRTLLGMSQSQLGEKIGLTFQQIQKYEKGGNRVSASRLFDLAKVLTVPIEYFFSEMTADIRRSSPAAVASGQFHFAAENEVLDPMVKRETLELARHYWGVESMRVRKSFFELTKAIAGVVEAEA